MSRRIVFLSKGAVGAITKLLRTGNGGWITNYDLYKGPGRVCDPYKTSQIIGELNAHNLIEIRSATKNYKRPGAPSREFRLRREPEGVQIVLNHLAVDDGLLSIFLSNGGGYSLSDLYKKRLMGVTNLSEYAKAIKEHDSGRETFKEAISKSLEREDVVALALTLIISGPANCRACRDRCLPSSFKKQHKEVVVP